MVSEDTEFAASLGDRAASEVRIHYDRGPGFDHPASCINHNHKEARGMRRCTSALVVTLLALGFGTDRLLVQAQDRDTKVRNDRKAFGDSKEWIYNNLTEGIRVARETHKPLMVVFRCIP